MNGIDRQNNTNSPRSASSPRKVVSSEKCPGRQMAVVYLVPAGAGAGGGWRVEAGDENSGHSLCLSGCHDLIWRTNFPQLVLLKIMMI